MLVTRKPAQHTEQRDLKPEPTNRSLVDTRFSDRRSHLGSLVDEAVSRYGSLVPRFLRRAVRLMAVAGLALVVGCAIGVSKGYDALGVIRVAVQVSASACALLLILRVLLILVSLDPDKPRAWRRQNGSAPEYDPSGSGRS